MGISQKYYFGGNVIYRQYLGDSPTSITNDIRTLINPVQRGLRLWYDAATRESYPGSGSVWYDLSPAGQDVTLNAGVSYTASFDGNLVFDPNNNARGLIGGGGVQCGTEWTVTTWINVNNTPGCIIGDAGTSQPANEKINFRADGNILVRTVESGPSVNFDFGYLTGSMNGEWHQITVMSDSNNIIYACVDTGSYVTGSALAGNPNFELIGDNNNNGQHIDASYSNLLLYTASLSELEVKSNYNAYREIYGY